MLLFLHLNHGHVHPLFNTITIVIIEIVNRWDGITRADPNGIARQPAARITLQSNSNSTYAFL